mmetsp:Transcript_39578/g.51854  ORF Transcript_39578/g.51854 Transcript_39578/m.51854 type:complete len:126 (-) Transcript_39578:915-1292(-)
MGARVMANCHRRPELFLILTLAPDQSLHLARMNRLHLLWADHLRVLEVAQEILHLVGKETVGFNAPLLLFLLLDLEATDLVAHLLFEVAYLPRDPLVKDHDVLQQVQLHLRLLFFKLLDRAPNRL